MWELVAPNRPLQCGEGSVIDFRDKAANMPAGLFKNFQTKMLSAITHLEQLADKQLFKELSEGMPHIVANAADLDRAACCLFRNGKFRASDIMRGFAEEEAGKFLVLIDYVRCPRNWDQRAEVLKRFYGHVAKRLYAEVCSRPYIWLFSDLSEFVECECRSLYLEGPNDVDWILPNSIATNREQALYVDYVKDITNEPSGDYYWTEPAALSHGSSPYKTPECVRLSKALSQVGATSIDGLTEIAGIWRKFVPEPGTKDGQLHKLIVHTLERLSRHKRVLDDSVLEFIVSHWPFPMWPLTMKEPRLPDGDLEGLRENRRRIIQRIEEIESKRDPAPEISRPKVEELDIAYAAWRREREVDAPVANRTAGLHALLRLRSVEEDFQLPSYVRLQGMFRKLTGKERVTLLALGWYTRDTVADWPRAYKRAVEQEPILGERYQIGCARDWLNGLNRWEEGPQPFQAGRWRWRRSHRH